MRFVQLAEYNKRSIFILIRKYFWTLLWTYITKEIFLISLDFVLIEFGLAFDS